MKPVATYKITPLQALAHLIEAGEEEFSLLYSAAKTDYSGRFSYLGFGSYEELREGGFEQLNAALQHRSTPDDIPYYIGYLGYGLKNEVEQLPRDKDDPFFASLSDMNMRHHRLLLVFDALHNEARLYSDDEYVALQYQPIFERYNNAALQHIVPPSWRLDPFSSDMTKQEYLRKVEQIREHIKNGDISQANLTRKFYSTINAAPQQNIPIPQIFTFFRRMAQITPSCYMSWLQHSDTAILSSSPEQFLRIDSNGNATARPIKGSIPRATDPLQDKSNKEMLHRSIKDRAENLMITDLMRHDFSRSSTPGSVRADELFHVSTYKTIHHMSSRISAVKRPDISIAQFIGKSFPPGSMTGTPKIKAMEICSRLEPYARGVYSGAIGHISPQMTELSVVIRTLMLQRSNGRMMFQAGGAITIDSTPHAEWEETIAKSRGILRSLGLDEHAITSL